MPTLPVAAALSCAPSVPLFTLFPLNIILFEPEEFFDATPAHDAHDAQAGAHTHVASVRARAHATLALPRADPRTTHILDVLRRKPGDTFDAGLIDGPRGKATLAAILPATPAASTMPNAPAAHAVPNTSDAPDAPITPDTPTAPAASAGALSLTFSWDKNEPPPLPPVTLVIGLPRPQTARKILNEATSLGVSEIHFVTTGRGEPSYAQSALWTTGEYRRHLIAGAAQAFCTRIPRVTFGATLAETITALAAAQPGAHRIALDNYESPAALSDHLRKLSPAPASLILALGSERGWTAAERAQLRTAQYAFAHLGARVLRTETAATAALSLALARLERL